MFLLLAPIANAEFLALLDDGSSIASISDFHLN